MTNWVLGGPGPAFGARVCISLRGHGSRAVSQLQWTEKDREVWFSLGENHEKACRFGLHQLRNCSGGRWKSTAVERKR